MNFDQKINKIENKNIPELVKPSEKYKDSFIQAIKEEELKDKKEDVILLHKRLIS